jgi:DnaJ-class molecular chaperone
MKAKMATCPVCNGRGYRRYAVRAERYTENCPACHGEGYVEQHWRLPPPALVEAMLDLSTRVQS